jgi:1-acyl-sn-glycerol-3-phosphate acyltransferase
LFNVEVHVDGVVPPSTRGRLVVANHRSTIDIGALLSTFGGALVSRADLRDWPILGPAAKNVRTVFVDRTDAVSGASAIREIRERLKEGDTICMFPEGTTHSGDTVHPFHAGAFVAVLHTRAVIVPVGIAYNHGSEAAFVDEPFLKHLARIAEAPPTRVVLAIGSPLEIPAGARAAAVRDEAHAAVQALVIRARAISTKLDEAYPM